MSGRGYVRIHREIMNHPIVGVHDPKRFTAWCWMISQAAFKPHSIEVRGQEVMLGRGQFSHSIRHMSKVLGWSQTSFYRFLECLKTGEMIHILGGTRNGTLNGTQSGTQSGTERIVISICNYEEYQADAPEDGTQSGTESGTQSGTLNGTKKNKGIKRKKDSKEMRTTRASAVCKILCEILPQQIAEQFIEYRRVGKRMALTERAARGVVNKLQECREAGIDPERAIKDAMDHGWLIASPKYFTSDNLKPAAGGFGDVYDKIIAKAAAKDRERERAEAEQRMAVDESDGDALDVLPSEQRAGSSGDPGGSLDAGPGGSPPGGDRACHSGSAFVAGSPAPDPGRDPGGSVIPLFPTGTGDDQ